MDRTAIAVLSDKHITDKNLMAAKQTGQKATEVIQRPSYRPTAGGTMQRLLVWVIAVLSVSMTQSGLSQSRLRR